MIVKPTTPQPEVVGTTSIQDSSLFNDPNLITHSCGHGENDQRCRQPKIIDVNETEGLNLSTTEATQEAGTEEDPTTGHQTNIDLEKTTQSFSGKIRSTTQVPITSTVRTKSIFFTTPKILVITPKVKIEKENNHFTTVTSKTPMQFHPSTQPFTPLDAFNPPQEEITTEHLKFDPNEIRTKSPSISFFDPNSFRPSPKIPSNMFVPVRPVGQHPTSNCEPGSKSPECAVLVQNVPFKTVKPFIRAEATRRPSTFQGWWSTSLLVYWSTNII